MKRVRIETHDAVEHSTPKQLLQEALAAHRRGQIADAKRLYASLLSLDPANPAAIGNLAIIAAQEGDLAGAERLFRQEITLRPNDPAGFNNLGSVLQQQARWADAIAAHRRAIKLRPNYAEAHLALGNALKQQGHFDEALANRQPDLGQNPEQQAASSQRLQRMEAVLRALPEQDRCCLHLRAEGLRYREIAAAVGISLGAVSIALARSLARIQRANQG